jgi:hypothetical protein
MAKRSSKSAKGATFRQAMNALKTVAVSQEEFGKLNKDGTVKIDVDKLEQLKKSLGKGSWSKVRFVALNAPFKRRSPVPPA